MKKPTSQFQKPVVPADPRDLVEFFARWSEFRPMAERLTTKRGLAAKDRQLIAWLIALTDRISTRDIE